MMSKCFTSLTKFAETSTTFHPAIQRYGFEQERLQNVANNVYWGKAAAAPGLGKAMEYLLRNPLFILQGTVNRKKRFG